MSEVLKTIGVWLAGVSVTAAVLGGALTWIGRLIADRISASTNARYARELEQLKNQYSVDLESLRSQYSADLEHLRSELASHRDMLNSAHGALASGYAGAYERVVTAIEFLWNNMMDTRRFVEPYIFFYQIMRPTEYENASKERTITIQRMIVPRSEEEFGEEVKRLREGIDLRRPFLGERLWLYQTVYFAFAMRLAFKIREEREQGQFFAWNKNPDGTPDSIQAVLRFILSKDELAAIIGTDSEIANALDFGVPHRILATMESKILGEMNKWIFGKQLVTMSIEEQRRLAEFLPAQSVNLDKAAQIAVDTGQTQSHATT